VAGCGPRRANELPVPFEPGDLSALGTAIHVALFPFEQTDELILAVHTPITFLTDHLHRGILGSYAEHASNLGQAEPVSSAWSGVPGREYGFCSAVILLICLDL
jgi:hypothetical protein